MEYYLQSQIPSSNCVCLCVGECTLWHTVCGLPVCVLNAEVHVNNVLEMLHGLSVVREKSKIHADWQVNFQVPYTTTQDPF